MRSWVRSALESANPVKWVAFPSVLGIPRCIEVRVEQKDAISVRLFELEPQSSARSLGLAPSSLQILRLGAQTAAASAAPLLPELEDGGWCSFPSSQFLVTNLLIGSVSLEDAQ